MKAKTAYVTWNNIMIVWFLFFGEHDATKKFIIGT